MKNTIPNETTAAHKDYELFPADLDWQYGSKRAERPEACTACSRASCFGTAIDPAADDHQPGA